MVHQLHQKQYQQGIIDGQTLTLNTNYSVAYVDNTNVRTNTATVTLLVTPTANNYKFEDGANIVEFNILKASLELDATVIGTVFEDSEDGKIVINNEENYVSFALDYATYGDKV